MSNGIILWENRTIVCIATGFKRPSTNRKTGPMIQTYIIRRDMPPLKAISTGKDSTICGDCVHRGRKGKKRSCYVQVGKSVSRVYDCYQGGGYENNWTYDIFMGTKVRAGAYGDPAYVPFTIWRGIHEAAIGMTGYTHRWKKQFAQGYKKYFQASVDTTSELEQAWDMGWNTFRVKPKGAKKIKGEAQCPAATESPAETECAKCLLCCGNNSKVRGVSLDVHGIGSKHFDVTLN